MGNVGLAQKSQRACSSLHLYHQAVDVDLSHLDRQFHEHAVLWHTRPRPHKCKQAHAHGVTTYACIRFLENQINFSQVVWASRSKRKASLT